FCPRLRSTRDVSNPMGFYVNSINRIELQDNAHKAIDKKGQSLSMVRYVIYTGSNRISHV
ncbi:MAG: hypothetical protein PHU99_10215, partial [Candidatus Cloacimonetes bacterium]|nr:hypothetical protein [Candidatus Cloacimonadota bacterium]MDD4035698.1 hypothetical protein [Candidatus Cloacimonadota bacterium]